MASPTITNRLVRYARTLWSSPGVTRLRAIALHWRKAPFSGTALVLVGTIIATLFIMFLNYAIVPLSNPGLIYLPLVAMLAYYWGVGHAIVATILQLACVYFFFISPPNSVKPLTVPSTTQLVTLAVVTGYMLALVQLARQRRSIAEREATRLAALNRVGTALASELDESRLLHLIAETAHDLTGAEFAAFTLRSINALGQPIGPSEGSRFHLAAVVGVTKEQEAQFRRIPLGGEGLLAPIFRNGVPVRVANALAFAAQPQVQRVGTKLSSSIEKETTRAGQTQSAKEAARHAAFAYAHGQLGKEGLRYLGVPRGHPITRSFLGAPLLDRNGNVRGGLLLGHSEPDQFTQEDEALLVGLATQAAVALENARLYHAAQAQAQELDAIFESIDDGIALLDEQGNVQRENGPARHLREAMEAGRATRPSEVPEEVRSLGALLRSATGHVPSDGAELDTNPSLQRGFTSTAASSGGRLRPQSAEMQGERTYVTMVDGANETREYIVNTSPLLPPAQASTQESETTLSTRDRISGSVIVWHDVTEARRLLIERRAHAETEARRSLLQTVIDELPSGVYLVRGHDARLVLANRAVAEVWGASWPKGQPMSEFLATNGIRIFHFDGRPLSPGEFATLRAVQNGETVRHHSEIIRHRDGTTLPVLVNAVALNPHVLNSSGSDEDGRELEPLAIVVHSDVSALKEAERLKDEFIGIAAHELRTPLAVIKGFAQTLIIQTARGKGVQLADWQMEAISDIDKATTRLVELTEDLLDVTRLQGGRLELETEPTDLVALVQRVVARLRVTTETHSISISAASEHIVAQIDPRRIEQVLGNLINNAIKYSPEGGDIEISVREDAEVNSATLSVRDHGIGIPAHQQTNIFGRFVRADNARMREIGGTGLGLYLCHELVERHGGRIWFESVENQGSTFYVSLPLAEV